MSPTITDCPANGTGRAAVTAPLALGRDRALVYSVYVIPRANGLGGGSLVLYDTQTGKAKTLLNGANPLSDAQVSTDGQYVLFVNAQKLQMIRMDGQGVQTLYCTQKYSTGVPNPTLTEVLWSPNQQLAVFEEAPPSGGPAGPIVRLLNLSTGTVKTIAQSPMHISIQLAMWRGNTQVYYTLNEPPGVVLLNNVYALDVTAPANKNSTEVAPISSNGWDMNLTPNDNTLILNQWAEEPSPAGTGAPQNFPLPPSLITAQAAGGGTLRPVYVSHVHAVTQARVYSNQAMLLGITDLIFGKSPQNGLWKINLDGTGLTQMAQLASVALPSTRTAWATVSRDGTHYAVLNVGVQGAGVQFDLYNGSLSGGVPTNITEITSDRGSLSSAGWTTM
ncbi:MAG: hypothetical protein PVS3B3_07210 [Ktedonobacteraceae bacterium]